MSEEKNGHEQNEMWAASEMLWAASIYGAHARKGLVKLSFKETEAIISPAEARRFALSVLEAAESAETDEFIMSWLSERVGQTDDAQNDDSENVQRLA